MRTVSLAGMLAACLLLPQLSVAQTPSPDQQPAPQREPAPSVQPAPRAAPQSEAPPPRAGRRGRGPTGKRAECRDQARNKGLRGRPMQDAALICYQEARLDCLKKAVADGVARRERREYIANCLGEDPRPRRGGRDRDDDER